MTGSTIAHRQGLAVFNGTLLATCREETTDRKSLSVATPRATSVCASAGAQRHADFTLRIIIVLDIAFKLCYGE